MSHHVPRTGMPLMLPQGAQAFLEANTDPQKGLFFLGGNAWKHPTHGNDRTVDLPPCTVTGAECLQLHLYLWAHEAYGHIDAGGGWRVARAA